MFINGQWVPAGPLWAPADEDGGDDVDPPAGDGDPPGGDRGDDKKTLMDLGGDDEGGDDKPDDKPAAPYKPEGIADNLLGKTDQETIDNLFKAHKGARDAIAKGVGKLEGEVHTDASKYQIESTGDDDKIAAELNSEASKPIMDAFRAAAAEVGVPDKAFAKFMRMGVEKAAEAGIPIGLSEEEAIEISAAAEMEKLVEMAGDKKLAGQMHGAVKNFGEQLLAQGVLSKDDMAEWKVMVGTAESVKIMHRIMSERLGEKPIPVVLDGGAGALTQQDVQAEHHRALQMKAGPERDAAVKAAEEKFAKLYEGSTETAIRAG